MFHAIISLASNVISLCLIISGGMMLFFPDRAFRGERKPRWLGLPILCLGLAGGVVWLVGVFS